jgi:vanillate O-demethylase ferredoxin subunit
MSLALIDLRLKQIRLEADDICSYDFVAADAATVLPSFTAGAHIDLHLPGNRVRSYSLANAPYDTGHYRVAVQREQAGRGGSAWMHDDLRVGQVLKASAPANDFPLTERAEHSVFIAGGIGITPALSMIARLDALGRSWRLHYATRSHRATAFIDELAALDRGRGLVSFVQSDSRLARIDMFEIVKQSDAATHLYCCGPARMIDAFTAACTGRNPVTVHVERFAAAEAPAVEGGFEVLLSQSGRRIAVAPGKTILDALLDNDVSVPYACSNGVCGTCLTAVVSGTPDHRDEFLSPDEKRLGRSIVVCCSGSCSPVLELDL